MSDSATDKRPRGNTKPSVHQAVSLKQLAAHLGLNPATVSVVLNDVPGRSIPQVTRDRIKAAAKAMNYQPSLLARSLRNRRTLTIGILVPELGDGYHTEVMSGIGDELVNGGYFYFTAHHRHQKRLVNKYTQMFLGHGAQGIIAIDTLLEHHIPVPVVAVAGHRRIEGVTNIVLDHALAAELALNYLYSQGHRNIAFMRGQSFSSDSDERWESLMTVAAKLGLEINPELIVHLDRDISSPELGYPVVQKLLASKQPFTALVAFNDISAIGSIRALEDMSLRVPRDVSVIGFDDIKAAAYTLPRLTTISQPLAELGRIATQNLLNRIHETDTAADEIRIEPKLVIRESTGPAKDLKQSPSKASLMGRPSCAEHRREKTLRT
jgi:LacI family transcriptional regulator